MLDKNAKLNDTQLNDVSGGSHYSWDEVKERVGQKMLLSWTKGNGGEAWVRVEDYSEEEDERAMVVHFDDLSMAKVFQDDFRYDTGYVQKIGVGYYVVSYDWSSPIYLE